MIDPFSSAPADEAQTSVAVAEPPAAAPEAPPAVAAPAPAAEPAKAKPAPKPKVATAATSEGGVTVTFKGGIGFQAPWIVIHADSVQDAHDQVSGENAALLAALMERTQTAGKHFVSLAPEFVPAATAVATNVVNNAPPPGATQAPGGETRTCPHGQMVYRTGEKNGRVWKAYMCPSPKGTPGQCDAQWLR